MTENFMILPATDFSKIRILKVPEDISKRDALRHTTALIASVQEGDPESPWEDILSVLEDQGFHAVDFFLGPELD